MPPISNEAKLHPVDVVVLRHLRNEVDYPTCIAVHREIDQSVVEARCERLAERELVEPVSPEVVYRITEAGRSRLAARAAEADDPVRVEPGEQSDLQYAGTQ
jgi:DNA-binding MarR family transcriptional regulator